MGNNESSLKVYLHQIRNSQKEGKGIRKEEKTKTIPIIILSSSDDKQDIETSYLLRAKSYVKKPPKFNNFIETIKDVACYWLQLNEVTIS